MKTNFETVKVKKFNQARVNGGSNYDSLKVGPPTPSHKSFSTFFFSTFSTKQALSREGQPRTFSPSDFFFLVGSSPLSAATKKKKKKKTAH
jgi:hypothetical protein